jgi:hypothetical protein
MPCLARCCALLLPLLASPALAQADHRLRPLADESRRPEALIAAARIGERVQFGLGRFGVADRPRLRSHVEPVPPPTDVRRRHRGNPAIGFSLSF